MDKMSSSNNEEIDILDLFQQLWDGKWLIAAFAAISILLGSTFILMSKKAYESKLLYSINNIPPFYSNDKVGRSKVYSDFQEMFYSKDIFIDWKRDNASAELIFDNISRTKEVNGFLFSKDRNASFAFLTYNKTDDFLAVIKTNKISLINDFYNYNNYVNKLLKGAYLNKAKINFNTIKIWQIRSIKKLSTPDAIIAIPFLSNILSFSGYIEEAKNN